MGYTSKVMLKDDAVPSLPALVPQGKMRQSTEAELKEAIMTLPRQYMYCQQPEQTKRKKSGAKHKRDVLAVS